MDAITVRLEDRRLRRHGRFEALQQGGAAVLLAWAALGRFPASSPTDRHQPMASTYDSELAKKLNLKSGMKVHVVDPPPDVELGGLAIGDSPDADGVIIFVQTLAEVDAKCGPALELARLDRIAWLAYPKGGKLGTDLNRDILWKHMLQKGVQGVRQVAIDETWSALRFRPSE